MTWSLHPGSRAVGHEKARLLSSLWWFKLNLKPTVPPLSALHLRNYDCRCHRLPNPTSFYPLWKSFKFIACDQSHYSLHLECLLCFCKSVKMQFSFPVLERKEILSCLSADAGITLEEQHLVKPSMETVWPVYESLVLNIMGITRCDAYSPLSIPIFVFHTLKTFICVTSQSSGSGALAFLNFFRVFR